MKKLFLATMAWLCLALAPMNAQNEIEQKLLYMLSEIDTEPVRKETGILADRVPNYVPIQMFDGKIENDSLFATRENFILSYAIIRNAHVDELPAFSQDSLLRNLEYFEAKPLIPLGLMTYRYQRIVENAVEDKKMHFDGDKFRSLVETPNELFLVDTFVMGTCLKKTYLKGLEVPFILPKEFKLGNLDAISLLIDFGDGNGFIEVNSSQVYRITYPEGGKYTLHFRLELVSGEILEAKSQLDVFDQNSEINLTKKEKDAGSRNVSYNSTPDGKKHFGGLQPGLKPKYDDYGVEIGLEPDYDNLVPSSGVFVNYWLNKNCQDPKIRKPLIIISGFDPGNNYGPDKLINFEKTGLLDLKYELEESFKDLIHDQNYDIFFINYYDSKIDIRENAAFVKEAMEWINNQKRMNGSSEKNVVLGVSMGGLVSKWMLQEFEMNGEDHETQLFMTFDSPMRGANIPLALQALPLRLGDRKILGIPLRNLKKELMNGVNTVSSKAAKQMLYYNLSVTPEFYVTPGELSIEHDAFFAELDSRGELNVPYIPFSNGSINSVGQKFMPNEIIQNIESTTWVSDELNIVISASGKSISNNDMIIHNNRLSYEYYGAFIYSEEELRITCGFIEWDNAPGGLRTFEDRKNGVITNENGFLYKSFCFIPTISAIDLRGVTDPFFTDLTDVENIIENFAPQIRSYEGSIETSIQFEEEQTNQEHVSLNNRLAKFLLGHLSPKNLEHLVLNNRTFNFGSGTYNNNIKSGSSLSTGNVISNNLLVENTGKLWINRNNKIAFIDEQNLQNSFPKEFSVTLGKSRCEGQPTAISVENGGEIYIGDQRVANEGNLIIGDGTSLIVRSNGKILIDDKSKIVIKKGGSFNIFEGGTIQIFENGKIIIEDGGNLYIEQGANIILDKEMPEFLIEGATQTGSVVQVNGTIIAKHGIIETQGKGYFWFPKNCKIITETNDLKLVGHGKNYTAYRFDSENIFQLNKFEIFNAKCMFNKPQFINNTQLVELNNSLLYSPIIKHNTLFSTDEVIRRNNVNIISMTNVNAINVNNSFFDDLPIQVDQFESFFANTSEFITTYKGKNLWLKNGVKANFTDCTIGTQKPFFISAPSQLIKKTGLFNDHVFETRLNNCKLGGFNKHNSRDLVPQDESELIAIRHEGSPFLYINKSEIKQSNYGFFSPDATNIVMDNSTIKDCWIGIQMKGLADLGMVKMMCSSLINNRVGINGQDILLSIDGVVNGQTKKNGFITSNYFDNVDSHFSICYKEKELESFEIPARQNTWVDPNKYSLGFCGNTPFIELMQLPFGGGMCARAVNSLCDDTTPDFPMIPPGANPDLYEVLCTGPTCQGFPILENYWKGFSCFYNDDIDAAKTTFKPLSEEAFIDDGHEYSYVCKSILKEANAFVSGFHYFKKDSVNSTAITIIPNCNKTDYNEFETKLTLNVPKWLEGYASIKWFVSEGGIIHTISSDRKEITTNGLGKYMAVITGTNCNYMGEYTFNSPMHPPYSCPPRCLTDDPILIFDELNCYLYLLDNLDENIITTSTITYTLQKFEANQWQDITNSKGFYVQVDGVYRFRVSIEGCDSKYSNFITTNCASQCHCTISNLIYNQTNCTLQWNDFCEDYQVILQKQNNQGIWQTLLLNPISPFSLAQDGVYRIQASKTGCSSVLSNSVSTNCVMPGLCSCTPANLEYNASQCKLSWNQAACSGFSISLEKQTNGVWSHVTSQSPYLIPNNANGSYRLVYRKAGCFPVMSTNIVVNCSCTSPDFLHIYDTGILGADFSIEANLPIQHLVPFSSNICESRTIEVLFSKSEMNEDWDIIVDGSEFSIDWNYTEHLAKMYIFLPSDTQSGTTNISFMSECGDVYEIQFDYNCDSSCLPISIDYTGNTIGSCENINLLALGGSHPYTFTISGTGNLGTQITQQGNEIDLSDLLTSEVINLQILVTDANGCTGISNINYIRCGAECDGFECSILPIQCGQNINTTNTGYNENAIVNFVVGENTETLDILLSPLSRPQKYEIRKNDNVVVFHNSIGYARGTMICEGFNYFYLLNNTNIPTDEGVLIKRAQFAEASISVNEGDVITVKIENPDNCDASSWNLIFECNDNFPLVSNNNNSPELQEFISSLDYTTLDILDGQLVSFDLINTLVTDYPLVKIKSQQPSHAKFVITNNLGQIIYRRESFIDYGENIESLEVSELLPTGIYNISLHLNDFIVTKRFIKI